MNFEDLLVRVIWGILGIFILAVILYKICKKEEDET